MTDVKAIAVIAQYLADMGDGPGDEELCAKIMLEELAKHGLEIHAADALAALRVERDGMREAFEWLWGQWVKTESEPSPGVFHTLTDYDRQVKEYACVGCDATASACWPTWVYDFKHAPDCKVAKAHAALTHPDSDGPCGEVEPIEMEDLQ